jgi:mono/diheme cytochrome c family protein
MDGNRAFFGTWVSATGSVVRSDESLASMNRTREDWWPSLRDREAVYAEGAKLLNGAKLDSQGRKSAPNACTSCHGGRMDAASGFVVGASLLPIVPGRVLPPKKYQDWVERAPLGLDDESVRRVNSIVMDSSPAPAIVAQLNAIYGGSTRVPGTRGAQDTVPAGWRDEPGIYRQVIGPYCASCHFAQTGALALASPADVKALRDAVQTSVCTQFTMPHSEILFNRFHLAGVQQLRALGGRRSGRRQQCARTVLVRVECA